MTHRLTPDDQPTQCQHPHRAVARSSLAAAVGSVPILWPLVNRELGPVWATVAAVLAVAGNALITRALAVPAVEAWLREMIPGLSADGRDRPHGGRLDLARPAAPVFASAVDEVTEIGLGGTVHAAAATRTVSGLVLPWNQPGPTTAGELTIARNAVRLPRDLSRVKLHFKHTGTEGHRPVGYASAYEVRPDGLWMTFQVAGTPDGTAALGQVTEGVFDGFSAELASIRREGSTVTDSIMTGVALVDTPAFSDARVSEVHAAHQGDTTVNVAQFLIAMIRAGSTESAARAAAVEHFGQAAVDAVSSDQLGDAATPPVAEPAPAPAAEPAQVPAPVPAQATAAASLTLPTPAIVPQGLAPAPRVAVHASAYDAAQTLVRMIHGGRDGIAHAALSDITNSGMVDALPPQWLGELWEGPAKTRELIPLLDRRPLTSWRMQGFKWTQKPLVAAYAGDKAEIPTGPVSVAPYEAEATRWAGGHDLDRKFFDFGDAAILDAYWRAMNESYAIVTDQAAGAFIVANAKTVAPLAAVGEIPAMVLAMYQAKNAVKNATGVNPSYYLANSADQLTLLALTAQNKPAFWDQLGVDPSMILWRDSVPAGTLVAGAKPACTFWELSGSPLRVEAEHLSHGGRDRAMFGYTGQTLNNSDGLVKVAFGGGA